MFDNKQQEMSQVTNFLLHAKHPCFSSYCNKYARIHLPIAPECNLQCNYCLRKYNCPNESRPGVAATVLTPIEAVAWYKECSKQVENLTVVGVAGPGDALANWQVVKETFLRIRELDKEVFFCLSTNGLLLPQYAAEIADLGIQYITVTINAVNIATAAQIYKYAYDKQTMYYGLDAAKLILQRQWDGLHLLKKYNIYTKINTVAIPTVNIKEIPVIAQRLKQYNCVLHNILPLLPVKGTPFSNLPEPSNLCLKSLRQSSSEFIPQMFHCNRCRADAVGRLDQGGCSNS